jgi:CBS domain-containing protein
MRDELPRNIRGAAGSSIGETLSMEGGAMRVRDLCIDDVAAARLGTTLERAGELMHRLDVGCLPVVNGDGRIFGVVTDRDLFLVLARTDRRASEIVLGDIIREGAATCSSDDDVRDALAIMRTNRVRRLPVIDDDGRVTGMLSIDDVVAHAAEDDGTTLDYRDIVESLGDIVRLHADAPARRARGRRRRAV